MILGIETTPTRCGWALLDEATCSFVDLGVVTTKPITGTAITLDRARRFSAQSRVLAEKAPGCSTIVVERMSFPRGGAAAASPIALSWGVLIGIHATLSPAPRLLTIAQHRWQREVLPSAEHEIDRDELARKAAAFILTKHPRAARALERIPAAQRTFAIDAAMLALVGALRPARCEQVAA